MLSASRRKRQSEPLRSSAVSLKCHSLMISSLRPGTLIKNHFHFVFLAQNLFIIGIVLSHQDLKALQLKISDSVGELKQRVYLSKTESAFAAKAIDDGEDDGRVDSFRDLIIQDMELRKQQHASGAKKHKQAKPTVKRKLIIRPEKALQVPKEQDVIVVDGSFDFSQPEPEPGQEQDPLAVYEEQPLSEPESYFDASQLVACKLEPVDIKYDLNAISNADEEDSEPMTNTFEINEKDFEVKEEVILHDTQKSEHSSTPTQNMPDPNIYDADEKVESGKIVEKITGNRPSRKRKACSKKTSISEDPVNCSNDDATTKTRKSPRISNTAVQSTKPKVDSNSSSEDSDTEKDKDWKPKVHAKSHKDNTGKEYYRGVEIVKNPENGSWSCGLCSLNFFTNKKFLCHHIEQTHSDHCSEAEDEISRDKNKICWCSYCAVK